MTTHTPTPRATDSLYGPALTLICEGYTKSANLTNADAEALRAIQTMCAMLLRGYGDAQGRLFDTALYDEAA